MKHRRAEFSASNNSSPHTQFKRMPNKSILMSLLTFIAILLIPIANTQAQQASNGQLHTIELVAQKLDGGYFAYGMQQYTVSDMDGGNATDITSRFPSTATIPGPTIVISEGDEVDIKLIHAFDSNSSAEDHVSVHVHGVHYDIISDGTLEYINFFQDESATPAMSYEYRWIAAPGTAGTWPYHDHNLLTHNGAEDRGLYGAVIVNPASNTVPVNNAGTRQQISLDAVAKDFVLFVFDDAFMGTVIDNATGQQTPGGANPTLTAQQNTNVRFHLIALGTNIHHFALPGYSWPEPGTNNMIDTKTLGPIEKHVFTVNATQDSSYMDNAFTSRLLRMEGSFLVN